MNELFLAFLSGDTHRSIFLLFPGIAEQAEVHLRHPKLETHVVEGVSLSLKCHAEGNPEPEVEWYKNSIR